MSKSDSESGEENVEIQFEPSASHPIVDLKTCEEDETCLFRARAKLFRFDAKSEEPEWKERGTGELKILQNPETLHSRVMMRRDKTLKVCANHRILSSMRLTPSFGTDKGFVWKAPNDYADNEVKTEIFGVRFATADLATDFKSVFDNCAQNSGDAAARSDAKSESKRDAGSAKPAGSISETAPESKEANQLTESLSQLDIQSEIGKPATSITA
uniref:Ran-specific GTPase-activating protein n=1 Tax=Mesocestoides corti TaxID=53468 RepID=A0A5K3FJT1_MESCO